MTNNTTRLFIECVCSRTGKSWMAALHKTASVWVFAKHYPMEEFEELQRQVKQSARELRRQQLLERLAGLGNGAMPELLPPESVELTVGLQRGELTSDDIREAGFECPYCLQTHYLICCACSEMSCMGDIDKANRTICVRCGTLLQFGSGSGEKTSPVALKPTQAAVEGHERAFQRVERIKLIEGN